MRVSAPTLPLSRTVKQIREEIAALEGELASMAGRPLVIVDENRGTVADIPDGGCLLKYTASEGQFSWIHWYASTEAARSALTLLASEFGAVPNASGWGFDLAPERDVQAWIERREPKLKEDGVSFYLENPLLKIKLAEQANPPDATEAIATYGGELKDWRVFRIERFARTEIYA